MKRLLEQLDAIEAIVDTVSPAQIEQNAESVANRYQLYARSYNPLERVQTLRDDLLNEIRKGKPVNGYLSADYGYGKTATLVYLWHECQQNQIMAVPPFKFKELENLMVATYGWVKYQIQSEFVAEFEEIYSRYSLKSQQEQATEVARQFKIPEKKALQIVQQLKTNTIEPDTILSFWSDSVALLQKAGIKGLAIFADETQEFLRTEEGSSVRIQILSDLVKGMRALGNTPVALILGMPTDPTESAIEEQAGDIIHRMKEQKVSLRLADAYSAEFPVQFWESLGEKFLDNQLEATALAHPSTIESLGQLCDRKDLSNGPRTTVEVLKRIVQFVQENSRPYTALDLIEDYLAGRVQFYGAGQHRINHTISTLEQLPSVQKYPSGQDLIKLLAVFPAGLSESVAKELKLLESLRELVDDDNLYGVHIIQLTPERYALTALAQAHTPTVVDKILNQFRQRWFRDWNNQQKEEGAAEVFRSEIMPLLFPPSRSGQKGNWNWGSKQAWQEDRFGFYHVLSGAPERHYGEFPNRSLVVSVGTEATNLMKFKPPQETHLDWRFYLSYNRDSEDAPRLTAIAGTGQVDFHLQLHQSFKTDYPRSFGLLNKVIPAEQCSACTLLNLSRYIQDWLVAHSDVSKADRERLEQHRRECHQYALRLLFPSVKGENWSIEGLNKIRGGETKLIESVFHQKCKMLFPNYQSFYNNLRPTLLKYKVALEQVPLAVRRGHQVYSVSKTDFEKLFDTTGSALPSTLNVLKLHGLITDPKIAGKKGNNSQARFTQHPLELFMQEQLKTRGKKWKVDTMRGEEETQAIAVEQLWNEVQRRGYLPEEFEEAVEWLRLRRFVERNRQSDTIYQAVVELDPDVLEGHLQQLRTQVSPLLKVVEDKLLSRIEADLNKVETELGGIAGILAGEANADQLNMFNRVIVDSDNQQSLAEVALDEIQRTIQGIEKQFEEFCQGKRSELQRELGVVQFQLKTLTRDLMISKVSQPISGNSGLEACLDDHRKVLERQVIQLDKKCQDLAQSITLAESDALTLHRQQEQSAKSLADYKATQRTLSGLVTGLEQWRSILIRAEVLRDQITDNPEQLKRYEDEFVDRVVTHFSAHKVESFRAYEPLQRPLVELEEQLQSERRSRREAFNNLLNQYKALLERLAANQPSLAVLCRFDDEDRAGSYRTLRQVFLDKVEEGCDRVLAQWQKLEQDLVFLAQEREQDVTKLLKQVSQPQTQLRKSREKLAELVEDLAGLGEEIGKVSAIAQEGRKLQAESVKLQERKDENLTSEEKQLLDQISSVNSSVSISQLRQLTQGNEDIWEKVKTLYRKGHLDITINRRN